MTTPPATPPRVERTVTAVLSPGAPLLQQFDLPDAEGVVGDLLVGATTQLLDSLGKPGAVRITVTVEPVPVPDETQQATDPAVVVG